ncbi:hypothetical protein [Streptomonospora salina]|uniref:hypothetical protein n=1 Tax=Streptomonospora salina TaxID=104205 RepID=UPI0036D84159
MREADETGVSGTGAVAEGVRFSDGTVAVRWMSEYASTVFWPDIDTAFAVHGHDGATRLEWRDPADGAGRLPDVIRVVRAGDEAQVMVDDVAFPWFIARDSVSTFVRADELPAVAVELVCKRLEVTSDVEKGAA